MMVPGDRCPYRWGGSLPCQCELEVGHEGAHRADYPGDSNSFLEWGRVPSAWEPLRQFSADIPQRCGVCLEVMRGDEITHLPNFCQVERCPGAANPVTETVRVFRPLDVNERYQEDE